MSPFSRCIQSKVKPLSPYIRLMALWAPSRWDHMSSSWPTSGPCGWPSAHCCLPGPPGLCPASCPAWGAVPPSLEVIPQDLTHYGPWKGLEILCGLQGPCMESHQLTMRVISAPFLSSWFCHGKGKAPLEACVSLSSSYYLFICFKKHRADPNAKPSATVISDFVSLLCIIC